MILDELVQYMREELEAIKLQQSHYDAMLGRLLEDVERQMEGRPITSGVQMRINDSLQLAMASRTAMLVLRDLIEKATGEMPE